jgi:hypothetical protein
MTQIRSFIGATRRPGELGVHSLDEFNLIVPDMKVAETFYGEFGLELQPRGNRMEIRTQVHNHRWVASGCRISASACSKTTSRASKTG